jgi:hypothetical protein
MAGKKQKTQTVSLGNSLEDEESSNFKRISIEL